MPAPRRPHEADRALIAAFVDGAEIGGSHPGTAQAYKSVLTGASAWLRECNLGAMDGRLFSEGLENDFRQFAHTSGRSDVMAALRHLREVASSGKATIPAMERRVVPEHDQWLLEQALPDPALHSSEWHYRKCLGAFSAWLHASGMPALCDELHSDGLAAQAAHFENLAGHNRLRPALNHLRSFDLNGSMRIPRHRDTQAIPGPDQRLITAFQAMFNAELPAAKRSRDGRTAADKCASTLRSLSAWLQAKGLEPLAARLHHPSLDVDVDLWGSDNSEITGKPKSASFIRTMTSALRKLRATLPPSSPEATIARLGLDTFVNALGAFAGGRRLADAARSVGARQDDLQLFLDDQSVTGLTDAGRRLVESLDGRRREAADANLALRAHSLRQGDQPAQPWAAQSPSSSFQLPPTPSGGWDLSWINGLDPGTPGDEVTGPAVQEAPHAETVSSDAQGSDWSGWRRHWDVSTPGQEVTGPAMQADGWQARMDGSAHDAGTEPWGTFTGMPPGQPFAQVPSPYPLPQAPAATFDESDTGPGWQHGPQAAPQWLLDRGAYDQQVVRIGGVEYRVVAIPGRVDQWGEPALFIYPHFRGG